MLPESPLVLSFPLPRLADTKRLAGRLAARLEKGDVLLLSGPLGAGKTYLARCLIQALTRSDEEVPSPSFTLIQTYQTRLGFAIDHCDLYRLHSLEDVEELGLYEDMPEKALVIEWPERLGDHKPDNRLELFLSFDTDSLRRLRILGYGSWKDRLQGI